ncbi:hypothetical protein FQN51_009464 [Onygenales sp. PD_10]|nr:hypothetical protein FQN51_009464 [Onygenales sp. PD_10]
MCTTYEYSYRYDNDDTTAMATATAAPAPAKRSYGGRQTAQFQQPVSCRGRARRARLDERKGRYAGASAAIAFPHIPGVAPGSAGAPKIRSFVYNFGIRPEEASNAHGVLGKLISEAELSFFSESTPSAVGEYYQGSGGGSSSTAIAFAAVAAGVAALGSFLSPTRHPREAELVQYAKAILDDPASMRTPSVDHIIAWGMRVMYLRAATRPNNAWIASCTLMHLCEAVGLHEEDSIAKMSSAARAATLGHDADRLQRIFWISWAGHTMLRSCRQQGPSRTSSCNSPNSPFRLACQPASAREELCGRLRVLGKLHFTHPFLVGTKADLAFCIYRRIYQLKTGISDEISRLVIDSGNAAMEAVWQLASQGRLFWNVIGSVCQYACVLLAMDTPAAAVHLAAAFRGMAKKREELARLEAVEASCQSFQAQMESETNTAVPGEGWGWDWGWDQFLIEPYLSMLGPEVQL